MSSLEKAWHLWIERESSIRAAFFAFVMDAQHASLFGHVPALSVSDLRLPLPSSDALWEAPSASRWKRERSRHDKDAPPFLQTLRALLGRRPLPSISPFARFVVLHGLFSITKYMQARELTSMDVDADRASGDGLAGPTELAANGSWREVLDRAIETWSLSLISREPALPLEAARVLQRMAHITVHVNIVDFHVFAGAPSLTGNRITQGEHTKAKEHIEAWAKGPIAKRTLSHCILLIQETMFMRNRYRASKDNIALRPW